MKVGKKKKKKESFYILGYHPELIIKIWRFEKKILPNLVNFWVFFFFYEKSFVL
jgi:hypothetical protein